MAHGGRERCSTRRKSARCFSRCEENEAGTFHLAACLVGAQTLVALCQFGDLEDASSFNERLLRFHHLANTSAN